MEVRRITYTITLRIKSGKKKKHVIIAVLFAISGLICWCGISQVISNSVTSSFENAFGVPPIYTTIILVAVAAVIVLRKNATVKVLDIVVPIMAVCYFAITIFIIIKNIGMMPSIFSGYLRKPSVSGRWLREALERCS